MHLCYHHRITPQLNLESQPHHIQIPPKPQSNCRHTTIELPHHTTIESPQSNHRITPQSIHIHTNITETPLLPLPHHATIESPYHTTIDTPSRHNKFTNTPSSLTIHHIAKLTHCHYDCIIITSSLQYHYVQLLHHHYHITIICISIHASPSMAWNEKDYATVLDVTW